MVVDLKESRAKIDKIDKEIASLFEERMKVATDVAAYKRSTGKKVFDPAREEEKIHALRELTQDEFNKTGIEDLFRQIMSISRKYQYKVLGSETNEILPLNRWTSLMWTRTQGLYASENTGHILNRQWRKYLEQI